MNYLTVSSKHFDHVMFYAADTESGLIRQLGRKNFYARKISTVRTESNRPRS